MDERIKRLLERGREHFRAGELVEAEVCLSQLANERLPYADVYQMLGVVAHQKGRLDEANQLFEEALRLNPGYTEAALNLAVTLNDLGRYDDAKAVYKTMMATRKAAPSPLVDLDPFVRGKIANMHADVGAAYEDAGLPLQAAAELEKALALCPTYVDIRMRLGAAYRSAGHMAAALREYERVKKEKPQLVPARLQLGMTLYVARRFDDAAREWREVLAIEPDNKFARLYLGLIARESAATSRE